MLRLFLKLLFWWLWCITDENQKSSFSEYIFKSIKKKGLLYWNNYESVLSYTLSDCLWLWQFTASVESSMDVISLWHCWDVTEALVAFIAALNLPVLLGPTFLLFLLTAAQRFPVGLSQGLVGWSIKLINIIDNKLFGINVGVLGKC